MAMSDIRFNCSGCGQHLEAAPDMGGGEITCPSCHRKVRVPQPAFYSGDAPPSSRRPAPQSPSPAAPPPPRPESPRIPAVPHTRKTSGLAVASLVLGIIGFLVGWFCCGLIFPAMAIAFGHVALSQINKQPDELSGKEMAMVGLILGYVSLFLYLALGLVLGTFSALADRAAAG